MKNKAIAKMPCNDDDDNEKLLMLLKILQLLLNLAVLAFAWVEFRLLALPAFLLAVLMMMLLGLLQGGSFFALLIFLLLKMFLCFLLFLVCCTSLGLTASDAQSLAKVSTCMMLLSLMLLPH